MKCLTQRGNMIIFKPLLLKRLLLKPSAMNRAAAELEQSNEIFPFYFTAMVVKAVLGFSLKRQTHTKLLCVQFRVGERYHLDSSGN